MKVYPIKRENIESDSFTCKSCGETYDHSLMKMNLNVCPKCQYHYPVTAYDRISMITDSNSFSEFNKCLTSVDPLSFPEYKDKLVSDKKKTSLYDGVITEGFHRRLSGCHLCHGFSLVWVAWAQPWAKNHKIH